MSLGILDLVELAVVVALAIPIGLLGIQFLVDGDAVLVAGFLAVCAGLILVKFYLPSPTDVPKDLAQEGAAAVARDPEASEATDGEE